MLTYKQFIKLNQTFFVERFKVSSKSLFDHAGFFLSVQDVDIYPYTNTEIIPEKKLPW